MTKHTAETHAAIGFESAATAKVGAKGEAHLNLLGPEASDEIIDELHRHAETRVKMLYAPSLKKRKKRR